jgi:hypothetical protein
VRAAATNRWEVLHFLGEPLMKKFVVMMAAVAVAVGVNLSVDTESADARPQYKKEFDAKYMQEGSALQAALKTSNCNVCHQGKMRKNRNDYGASLAKALGEKDVKDPAKINQALEKAAAEKSGKDGPTFGSLLKDGKWKPTPDEPSGN